MASRNGRPRATLYDFRDLDLMVKLADHGGATSHELADLVGLNDPKSMGTRLGWMRHYGMIERDDTDGVWNLAPGGRRVVKARLRAAMARELDAMPEESMVEVMAHVATRYHIGDPLIATLLRREFLYGTRRGR